MYDMVAQSTTEGQVVARNVPIGPNWRPAICPRWLALCLLPGLLACLLPAPAAAQGSGLCISQDTLSALITDFAYGNAREGRIPVLGGDGCIRPVSGAARMTVEVQVFTRTGRDKLVPAKGPARKLALRALSFTPAGSDIVVRLVDRARLFVDPQNRIATYIYRIKVIRRQESIASGGVADLQAGAQGTCGSVIELRSPMDGSQLKPRRGQYVVRSEPTAAMLAAWGELRLEGLLVAPHHAAVFVWNDGTGGQRLDLDVELSGPGGIQTASVVLKNPCEAPAIPVHPGAPNIKVVVTPASGTMTRLKLGYPFVGFSFGEKTVHDDYQWAFSFDYDFDYVYGRGTLPWAHVLSMDFRAGPTSADGLSLLASTAIGMHIADVAPALYFAPKLILVQRGLPIQLAAGIFGTWDGDVGIMNSLVALEYVTIW